MGDTSRYGMDLAEKMNRELISEIAEKETDKKNGAYRRFFCLTGTKNRRLGK